ncbi:MAG: OmpA family protein [Desulfovibrionaceae bacterium]|nr:OmpA family protein [Desulfovibrionaceae bacterium]
MMNPKRLTLLALAALLTLSFAFAATAQAKMVKKVDNFILFVDQSGSMAMKAGYPMKKIMMAKENMMALNQAIPELDYSSGVYLFAPYAEMCSMKPYAKSNVAGAVGAIDTDFEVFNRRTPMGAGFDSIDGTLSSLGGKTALIMFTDGASNVGADPVAKAQAMRTKYGDRLCVHVVSYATTAEGMAVVEGIRAAFPCTVAADAATFSDAGALDRYAKAVFYEEVADAPKPAPMPAPVPMEKETISFNLNFDFDKYEITDEMTPILSRAKALLEQDPSATYVISGHTDATGTDAYNQGLSERRAGSVMNWLTANGISVDRLEAMGYGESQPKYDNTTKEGRRLNRRVEIQTK